MARHTLDRMAMGGMYDHLGGGFHRYSTDARWLVPHFEKMLYDNALLAVAYLEAFQATGEPFYREVVEETLAYVLREMTSPEGPFYSTQDADSEGVEGKFFVWTADEIETVLGKELAELFSDVYDVTRGRQLGRAQHPAPHAGPTSRTPGCCSIAGGRAAAAAGRAASESCSRSAASRVWPGRDEKILTAWNGLMIAAFAQAAQVLDKPEYAEAARPGRRLPPDADAHAATAGCCAPASAGREPKLNAYLEDYAFLIDALVSLYEATFEPRWIEAALDLAEVMIEQFWDEAEGGFFYTGRDHEQLIARTKDPHDSSTPSGNAMAVTGLLRLAKLTGRPDLLDKAEATLQLFRGLMASSPLAAGQMLMRARLLPGPGAGVRRGRRPPVDGTCARCCGRIRTRLSAEQGGGVARRRQRPREPRKAAFRCWQGKTAQGRGDDVHLPELRLPGAAGRESKRWRQALAEDASCASGMRR